MLTKDDLKYLRWSLLGALLMILLGAGSVIAARHYHQQQQKTHQQAIAQRAEAQGKLARARDEELEIRQKIDRFNQLVSRGIIGEERRLDWVEQVRRIKDARKFYDIDYELAPRQLLEASAAPGASGSFNFYASTMRLRLQLLHEEDLLHFLGDLRDTEPAFLRPRSCVIERLKESNVRTGGGIAPQLKTECVIDWITIGERKL